MVNQCKWLECPFLQKNESLKNKMTKIEFSDVYLELSEQIKVVRVFTKIMDIYEKKKDGTKRLKNENYQVQP
jgi:hypothetical protein